METKICHHSTCSLAGIPQPVSQFSVARGRKDGLAPYCKTCMSEYGRKSYQKQEVKVRLKQHSEKYRNSEHGKAHMKARTQDPEWREKRNEYLREYNKRPEVLLKRRQLNAAYRTRNTLKQRAREVYALARVTGRIVFPDHCEWCKKPAQPSELQGHHWRGYDPEYWLDVKYVHRACHLKCETVKPEDWP